MFVKMLGLVCPTPTESHIFVGLYCYKRLMPTAFSNWYWIVAVVLVFICKSRRDFMFVKILGLVCPTPTESYIFVGLYCYKRLMSMAFLNKYTYYTKTKPKKPILR